MFGMDLPRSPILRELCISLRHRQYALATERSYLRWVTDFIRYHKFGSREDMLPGESLIERYLTHLAVDRHVAASTQNQAMNALVYLYKKVLKADLSDDISAVRSRKGARVPVVLSQREVRSVLLQLKGSGELPLRLLYGAGLRLSEAVRLRVHDVDFEYKTISVRNAKGNKD